MGRVPRNSPWDGPWLNFHPIGRLMGHPVGRFDPMGRHMGLSMGRLVRQNFP